MQFIHKKQEADFSSSFLHTWMQLNRVFTAQEANFHKQQTTNVTWSTSTTIFNDVNMNQYANICSFDAENTSLNFMSCWETLQFLLCAFHLLLFVVWTVDVNRRENLTPCRKTCRPAQIFSDWFDKVQPRLFSSSELWNNANTTTEVSAFFCFLSGCLFVLRQVHVFFSSNHRSAPSEWNVSSMLCDYFHVFDLFKSSIYS